MRLFLRREFSASFRAVEALEAAELDDVDEDVVDVKQFSLVDILFLFHNVVEDTKVMLELLGKM